MAAEQESHRKKAVTFNEPGHAHFLTFSCYQRLPLLTNDAWRITLGQAFRSACDQYHIALWAYVFMPEHVHLLVKPRQESYDISIVRKYIKRSSAKIIVNELKTQRAPLLARLRVRERPGGYCYRFWQEGPGYDKNVWSMDKAIEKARYCHRNPVTRRLVKDPARWHWSSFRWLELGDRKDAPLRLDDWDDRLEVPALAANSRSQWHQLRPNPDS